MNSIWGEAGGQEASSWFFKLATDCYIVLTFIHASAHKALFQTHLGNNASALGIRDLPQPDRNTRPSGLFSMLILGSEQVEHSTDIHSVARIQVQADC